MQYSKIVELVERIRLQSTRLSKTDEAHIPLEVDVMKDFVRDLYIELSHLKSLEITHEHFPVVNDIPAAEPVKNHIATVEVITETKPDLSTLHSTKSHVTEEHVADTHEHAVQHETADVRPLNERFKREDKVLAEKMGKGKIEDLKRAFGVNDRMFYIRELFGGHVETFDSAMRKMNDMKSFVEADHYLKNDLAKKYNWDLDKKKVQQFIEVVERRFL